MLAFSAGKGERTAQHYARTPSLASHPSARPAHVACTAQLSNDAEWPRAAARVVTGSGRSAAAAVVIVLLVLVAFVVSATTISIDPNRATQLQRLVSCTLRPPYPASPRSSLRTPAADTATTATTPAAMVRWGGKRGCWGRRLSVSLWGGWGACWAQQQRC